MFFGRKHGWDRGCGPRGGHWSRGPLSVSWQFEDDQRGRSRRRFDGSELRLILLKLIGDQPRHGYELIRAIEDLTGGVYAPSPGVVYPTLTLLADMEFIQEAQSEGTRKRYAITEAGTAHLAEQAEQVDTLFAQLSSLGEARERADSMPVRRAMHNLRAVLQHRLAAGDMSGDTIHDVVALIDEAASKIERL